MDTSRRRLLSMAAVMTTALPALTRPAWANDRYPDKPIRVIVPYATGGADNYIRPLQAALERDHGITLVIESVPGAGGALGAGRVKRSPADGYTLLFCGSGALTIAPALQNADLALEDFEPILNVVSIPYVIATRQESDIRSGQAFIDFVRANPGTLTYGSPGLGSAPHLGMEAMASALGTSLTHVPYSGIATAVQAILGGHIDAVIGAPSAIMPQVQAGRLWPIGVTSAERFPLTPELPTLAEAGAPVEVVTHFGFYAPKGTPEAVVARIADVIRGAAQDPAYAQALASMQTAVELLPAEDFTRALVAERESFAPVIANLPKS